MPGMVSKWPHAAKMRKNACFLHSEMPKSTQSDPKRAQETPKRILETPKTTLKRPKEIPRDSKTVTMRSQWQRDGPKRVPRRVRRAKISKNKRFYMFLHALRRPEGAHKVNICKNTSVFTSAERTYAKTYVFTRFTQKVPEKVSRSAQKAPKSTPEHPPNTQKVSRNALVAPRAAKKHPKRSKVSCRVPRNAEEHICQRNSMKFQI